MKRFSLALYSLLVTCAGCGGSPAKSTGLLAPPPDGEGFQISMTMDAPAGAETWQCVVMNMPNEDLANVNRVEHVQTKVVMPNPAHCDLGAKNMPLGSTRPVLLWQRLSRGKDKACLAVAMPTVLTAAPPGPPGPPPPRAPGPPAPPAPPGRPPGAAPGAPAGVFARWIRYHAPPPRAASNSSVSNAPTQRRLRTCGCVGDTLAGRGSGGFSCSMGCACEGGEVRPRVQRGMVAAEFAAP